MRVAAVPCGLQRSHAGCSGPTRVVAVRGVACCQASRSVRDCVQLQGMHGTLPVLQTPLRCTVSTTGSNREKQHYSMEPKTCNNTQRLGLQRLDCAGACMHCELVGACGSQVLLQQLGDTPVPTGLRNYWCSQAVTVWLCAWRCMLFAARSKQAERCPAGGDRLGDR
jgi:hypothetical protein